MKFKKLILILLLFIVASYMLYKSVLYFYYTYKSREWDSIAKELEETGDSISTERLEEITKQRQSEESSFSKEGKHKWNL